MNQVTDLINRSLADHRSGRIESAENGYRQVLRNAGGDIDASYLLSLLLHENGRGEDALEIIDKAIVQHKNHPQLLNAKSVIYIGLGMLTDAEKLSKEAIAIDSRFVEAHANLATIYTQTNKPLAAIDHLSKILEIEPSQNGKFMELHRLCVSINRFDKLIAVCVQILNVNPHSVVVHLALGRVFSSRLVPEQLSEIGLNEQHRFSERAIKHLRTAASLKPCPDTYDAWGVALLRMNRQEEAIEKFDSAIEYGKENAKYYENRGRAKLEMGLLESSMEDFRKAILLEPRSAIAQLEIAKTPQSEELGSRPHLIEAITKETDLPTEIKIPLHFALAHRKERMGDFETAFSHFVTANSMKTNGLQSRNHNQSFWADRRASIERIFNQEFFSGSGKGFIGCRPIFIVSMPRSGTTLTEQILSSHPDVVGLGERFEISDIAHTLSRRLNRKDDYPDCVDGLTLRLRKELGRSYIERVLADAEASIMDASGDLMVRITDKMPTNFWHLGLIASILPNAKIVHVSRDPIDVCWSCFKHNLRWPFCDLQSLASYHQNYAQLMTHWKKVLPLSIHTVQYEELVQNPEAEIREILAHCDLSWDERCLIRPVGERAIQTPSKWQVRQPIYKTSVNAWRKYDKYLQPFVKELLGNEEP